MPTAAPPIPEHDAASLTVAAEQALVHLIRVPVERVRFTRRVVTETRQVQVQVRREELHVERTVIDDAADDGFSTDDPAAAGGVELVIVLSEEIPVVSTAIRPVERVRVNIVTVTDDEEVSVDLRREAVSVDIDGGVPVR